MTDGTHVVDARELRCPMPLIKAKQALNAVNSGDTVKVLTTDPQSVRDFQAFAKLSSHELLECDNDGSVFYFVLRKA